MGMWAGSGNGLQVVFQPHLDADFFLCATIVKVGAGRASCINARQLHGHNDPGAEAVARLFEHLAE